MNLKPLSNIHSLTEILKKRQKKLFCAFVDFEKAFDLISRLYLWQKLLANNNINEKFFKIIYQMYQGIKYFICVKNEISDLFSCNIGVRQGENLSLLFSLFSNVLDN